MRMTAKPAMVMAAAMCLAPSPGSAQSPSLDELLDRATAYVTQFFQQFSNVVAEEHYVQRVDGPVRQRVLRSDFLLVTFPGLQGRVSFRDVFEVNGRPVREAAEQDRLIKLFSDPPSDVMRRAREIAAASGQYHLTELGMFADPLITLGFLQAGFRPRFLFERGELDRALGGDVRRMSFEESQRPTVLRTGADDDLPARGLVWIEEATGRIVKTELRLRPGSEVVTTYRWDDRLGMTVPGEVRESYAAGMSRGRNPTVPGSEFLVPGREFRGVATYSRFRRFQVRTSESIR
jgi:hypothetical protein